MDPLSAESFCAFCEHTYYSALSEVFDPSTMSSQPPYDSGMQNVLLNLELMAILQWPSPQHNITFEPSGVNSSSTLVGESSVEQSLHNLGHIVCYVPHFLDIMAKV
jgi:hypothetical protein